MASLLSLEKLKSFIKTKTLIPTKIFTLSTNKCIFVEIANPDTGNTFMLYIPSKYNIEYTDTKISISTSKYEIENIPLEDIKKNDSIGLSKLLNRFIKCVKKIQYKIIITNGGVIAFINRHNVVEFYRVVNSNASQDTDAYNINIFVDLENFFKKKNIWNDIDIIKKNIYLQFEDNTAIYSKRIKEISEGTEYIVSMETIKEKKVKYYATFGEFPRLEDFNGCIVSIYKFKNSVGNYAVRNPFAKKSSYNGYIYHLDYSKLPTCEK